MKKKYLLLMAGALLLTGCGDKKLNCSQEKDGSKTNINVTFKDDKMDKLSIKVSADIPEDSSKDELEKSKDQLVELYESIGYKNVDIKINDKEYVLTADLGDLKAIFGEDIDESAATYDKLKEQFEKQDYTCK